MKVVTVVGARPQFVKAAAVSRALRRKNTEYLVHTGQHYDYAMSGAFFDGLQIPPPDINLEVGSGLHGAQTGEMLKGIEQVLTREQPDRVLVYGDTNSTLAGALAAAKLNIPIVHVEAGLRSYNRRMPEEINRIIADHLSATLLCPSEAAVANLTKEGISAGVHLVGDVMLDVLLWARDAGQKESAEFRKKYGVEEKGYLLLTLHRSENTDDPQRLRAIVDALNSVSETILFPVHPRARKVISAAGHKFGSHIKVVDPLSYFEMVVASSGARMILTDSGGLQKEAYWLNVPCVTLRDQTEWVETVDAGWNVLVGADGDRIASAVRSFSPPSARPELYGNGTTAQRCVDLL
jgi:UDP-GlcNAc3NAcA epimerase